MWIGYLGIEILKNWLGERIVEEYVVQVLEGVFFFYYVCFWWGSDVFVSWYDVWIVVIVGVCDVWFKLCVCWCCSDYECEKCCCYG